MHIKNIRKIVYKQLKTKHPHWKSMTKKSKKELAQEVVDEVVKNYDYSQILDFPIEQLTDIDWKQRFKIQPKSGVKNQPPSFVGAPFRHWC